MELVKSYKVHIETENGKAVCGHVNEKNVKSVSRFIGDETEVTCKKCLKNLEQTEG